MTPRSGPGGPGSGPLGRHFDFLPGRHFGLCGALFSRLPALLAEPSGEQAQAQSASAGTSAKRKRRAKSQGQQVARPQGLKGGESVFDTVEHSSLA